MINCKKCIWKKAALGLLEDLKKYRGDEHKFQSYTDKDMLVLINSDLPASIVSEMIGRTPAAIRKKRQRLGWKHANT